MIALAAAVGLAWTATAQAQAEHYGNHPYELNVNAGAHFIDSDGTADGKSDTDFGAGGRIFLNMPSGWGFGGNFTWVKSDEDIEGTTIDINNYLYSGEVEYTFRSPSRLHPFVGVGIGAVTTKVSDVPDEFDSSDTNLLIPVGGGLKWFNQSNSMAIRADVRDNIIRVSGDGDESDETFHNFELSGGISFLFGGGM